MHQLADTVRNSLNFYRMQEGAETVERALLTGPVLAIPGFADKLSEQLKLPVEPAYVMVDSDDESDPARLAVAAGSPSKTASRRTLSRAAASRRGRGARRAAEGSRR